MAYYNKAKKEHAFKLFQNDIKENKIRGLVLLCGIEDYLINWAVDLSVSKYVNEITKSLDCDIINLETAEIDDVIASCETTPMMSERKVVVIKNYNNEFTKDLIEYAKDLPETTLLLVTVTEIDKGLKDVGMVYDFEPLTQQQLVSFVNKRIKKAGKIATRGVINTFITETGYYNKDIDYNLYNLEGDIQKLIALNDEEEIQISNVKMAVSDNLEHGVFTLLDAISGNKKDVAFDLLHQLILSGEKEVKLLGSIISQLEVMLQSKQLAENGVQVAEIQKITKIHQFRVQKALNFTRRYSSRDIKKMLIKAYDTDGKIKRGILSSKMALEMLIAEI